MSFRLFVYYCMVTGAWSGFMGWVLGRLLAPASGPDFFARVLHISVQAMLLGFAIAFGLSLLDAIFNVTLRQFGKVFVRVAAATLIGVLGGLFGGFVGGSLAHVTGWEPVYLLSWTILGFLVGMAICFFEIVFGLIAQRDFGAAIKKLLKCVIGGAAGGFVGGAFAVIVVESVKHLAPTYDVGSLWLPEALGFIAIGACIGLLVGLAQVIVMDAWIRIELGFRQGRDFILAKDRITIGRSAGSDIAITGDSGIEKMHANIVLDNGRYYVEDLQTGSGTFVNDQRVNGRATLKRGDLIRLGKSVLSFGERARRS